MSSGVRSLSLLLNASPDGVDVSVSSVGVQVGVQVGHVVSVQVGVGVGSVGLSLDECLLGLRGLVGKEQRSLIESVVQVAINGIHIFDDLRHICRRLAQGAYLDECQHALVLVVNAPSRWTSSWFASWVHLHLLQRFWGDLLC